MKTSQNLLVEIKDEMGLKEINGAGWENAAMHTYKFIMTALGKKCSYSPLNNFYGKSPAVTCNKGGGCTCR